MDVELLTKILSIVVIDLVLSGDNALIIGMAARRLPPRQRRQAIIVGGAGAIGLRVLFTIAAALLLDLPFLQAAGGILLIWIAYKLLNDEAKTHDVKEAGSFPAAVRTIILADVVMSLDNMLAVGGAAHGSIELLMFGLVLSMPIILFGSSVVARLLNRMPSLMIIGSIVLAFTAARMLIEDKIIGDLIAEDQHTVALIVISVVVIGIVLIPVMGKWRKSYQERRASRMRQTKSSGLPE
jgi:YjbE family integral membrane protein